MSKRNPSLYDIIAPEQQQSYSNLLSLVARFSGLFSDNKVPFISYRVVENLFCHCFNALNLSRTDTAFDAKIGGGTQPDALGAGVGIKTFICEGDTSLEKIAEFNRQYPHLKDLGGIDLATKVLQLRNKRIDSACRQYNISSNRIFYHIVARRKEELIIYDVPYDRVNPSHLSLTTSRSGRSSNIAFEVDGIEYVFNRSKSTLFRKFKVPSLTTEYISLPVNILHNPIELLEHCQLHLIDRDVVALPEMRLGKNFVILPLFATSSIKKERRFVPEKSGLNQWNAGGRERDIGEVYVPIPRIIHQRFPNFFPDRNTRFQLLTPTNNRLTAKVCQDGGKALMTDPNKALASWLIEKFIGVELGTLITYEMLEELGFDSVIITKLAEGQYKIDKAPLGSYDRYILGDAEYWDAPPFED